MKKQVINHEIMQLKIRCHFQRRFSSSNPSFAGCKGIMVSRNCKLMATRCARLPVCRMSTAHFLLLRVMIKEEEKRETLMRLLLAFCRSLYCLRTASKEWVFDNRPKGALTSDVPFGFSVRLGSRRGSKTVGCPVPRWLSV